LTSILSHVPSVFVVRFSVASGFTSLDWHFVSYRHRGGDASCDLGFMTHAMYTFHLQILLSNWSTVPFLVLIPIFPIRVFVPWLGSTRTRYGIMTSSPSILPIRPVPIQAEFGIRTIRVAASCWFLGVTGLPGTSFHPSFNIICKYIYIPCHDTL